MNHILLALFLSMPASAQYLPTPVDSFSDVGTELNRIAIRLNQQSLINGGTTYGLLTVQGGIAGSGNGLTGIARSTAAASIPQATGTNTAFGGCVAGSTITLTCSNAGPALVIFSGLGMTNANNIGFLLAIEIDGAFPAGYSSANGIQYSANATAGSANNASFTFLTESLTAGAHTICLAARAQSAATWTLINDGSNGVPKFSAMCLAN